MPEQSTHAIPRHVAVIMDGNGRWAQRRLMPRSAGHRAGVKSTRALVESAARSGISVLTVFAFSSENWKRPEPEVSVLMDLFLRALNREVSELNENGICVRFIGERSAFPQTLREEMSRAETLTAGNTRLIFNVAVGYGGRWDITGAVRLLAGEVAAGRMLPYDITEQAIAQKLCLAGLPEPDLLIRTGGEKRISNFLLWQFAYTELYFCDTLWPDFNDQSLQQALDWYAGRERRFGRVTGAATPRT